MLVNLIHPDGTIEMVQSEGRMSDGTVWIDQVCFEETGQFEVLDMGGNIDRYVKPMRIPVKAIIITPSHREYYSKYFTLTTEGHLYVAGISPIDKLIQIFEDVNVTHSAGMEVLRGRITTLREELEKVYEASEQTIGVHNSIIEGIQSKWWKRWVL